MALSLFEGALDNVSGSVYFSEGIYPNETNLEEFDSQFTKKDKLVTESQNLFEKAASEIDLD